MNILDQFKKDLYRGPKCQSIETHREDVTPSKPMACIVCEEEVDALRVRTLVDAYTKQTEYYCPDCCSAISEVRKQEGEIDEECLVTEEDNYE